MKITDARAWLTARSSRVRTQAGEVMIGLPLEIATQIAALLPPEVPVVHPEQPVHPDLEPETVLTITSIERVIDTESGPVTEIHSQRIDTSVSKRSEKVPQKKAAKKKTKKRRRK